MSHISPKSTYYAIFAALMVLTLITVVVAFVDLGILSFPVALGIAIVKATLVVLYFMHVKYSSQLTKLFVTSTLFFLVVLFGLTMTDYLTRGWKTYEGGSAGAGYGWRSRRRPPTKNRSRNVTRGGGGRAAPLRHRRHRRDDGDAIRPLSACQQPQTASAPCGRPGTPCGRVR
jgi:cytochrome c oxidase subunit IV